MYCRYCLIPTVSKSLRLDLQLGVKGCDNRVLLLHTTICCTTLGILPLGRKDIDRQLKLLETRQTNKNANVVNWKFLLNLVLQPFNVILFFPLMGRMCFNPITQGANLMTGLR